MDFSQRLAALKPYITGFFLGLIAAPIIAFSAGWVSTSGARAEAVESARIDTLSGICSSSAERIAIAENTTIATVKGFDNRDKREELVAAAMADIPVPEALVRRVTTSCNRTLA